jgi:integrase
MAVTKVVGKNKTTWYYSFRVYGVRYRAAIPEARNKQQAEMAETRIRNEIFDGRFGGKLSSPKLKDFVSESFLPWALSNRRSWRKDAPRLKPILEFFGEKRLGDISPFLIEKYKMERKATPIIRLRAAKVARKTTKVPTSKPRSVASVNRELSMLSRIFSIAKANGEVSSNPCAEVKSLVGEQPRTRYLFPEEEQRLMAVLESTPYLRTIVILALNTGMRRGEILRLTWLHIDFHSNEIKATHTKTHRDRFIPMNAKVREELLRLRETSEDHLVFPGRKAGCSLMDVKKAFNTACRRSGILDFHFHDLRHTFGTRAAEAGVALNAVAAVMGHADIHTTMRYAHATDDGRRRAVEAVESQARRTTPGLVKNWPKECVS